MTSALELVLWHCPPIVDAVAAHLTLAAVAALGAASRAMRDVMHGPDVLGRRLAVEGAFSFRSAEAMRPWARDDTFIGVGQSGGDVVVRVSMPPSALAEPASWSRCRGRLASAWARVRTAGCPPPANLFAEGVLAGAACGDARLVARCIGSATEYMCRTDDHGHALDAVEALNDRAWRETDIGRVAPVVVHVTTVLLARAHALATGDHIDGCTSAANDDMRRLYQRSACHVGTGLERIEAEALRRLFGAFCSDLGARPPRACALAARVVDLFTGRRRDAVHGTVPHTDATAALVTDCLDAVPGARDRDPRWYAMLACAAAGLTLATDASPMRFGGALSRAWADVMDIGDAPVGLAL
ncbi:hypothetical protein pdul_cds_921 [Pandoravirus dulcis]|uniref:Uncharacterized protein n=1 Tax=Pandoravirus dulcis TaxID=1349409 RepID=A0A291AUG0_9VIRU|nr:hypothetical protein pdul_cds_921 [Pandoravirus dulcis]ATE82568.1 hypothetical protein pdul_cds_921 [Pandoravirus dulcis]